MKAAIIAAKPDVASLTIRDQLLELYPFTKIGEVYEYEELTLHTLPEKALFTKDLDEDFTADLFVFISKHVAKSGKPSYTCHPNGNWTDEATYGGLPKKMSMSSPSVMRAMLRSLEKHCSSTGRDVVHEVTHHGPLTKTPSIFVEIGSSQEEWENKENGTLIAHSVIHMLTQPVEKCVGAIGIGGLHTAPTFSKITLTTPIGFAHMIPKHHLGELSVELLKEAIQKSSEPIKYLVLDWKGLGEHKQRVKDICEEVGVKVLRSDKVKDLKL